MGACHVPRGVFVFIGDRLFCSGIGRKSVDAYENRCALTANLEPFATAVACTLRCTVVAAAVPCSVPRSPHTAPSVVRPLPREAATRDLHSPHAVPSCPKNPRTPFPQHRHHTSTPVARTNSRRNLASPHVLARTIAACLLKSSPVQTRCVALVSRRRC